MTLPDEAVKEFMEIYEKDFGKGITFEEARIKAENFLNLMKLITTPSKSSTKN